MIAGAAAQSSRRHDRGFRWLGSTSWQRPQQQPRPPSIRRLNWLLAKHSKHQADQACGHDMSRHLVDPCHIVVIVVEHELDKGLWKLHDMLFLLSAPLWSTSISLPESCHKPAAEGTIFARSSASGLWPRVTWFQICSLHTLGEQGCEHLAPETCVSCSSPLMGIVWYRIISYVSYGIMFSCWLMLRTMSPDLTISDVQWSEAISLTLPISYLAMGIAQPRVATPLWCTPRIQTTSPLEDHVIALCEGPTMFNYGDCMFNHVQPSSESHGFTWVAVQPEVWQQVPGLHSRHIHLMFLSVRLGYVSDIYIYNIYIV